jgi:hypothetical protein
MKRSLPTKPETLYGAHDGNPKHIESLLGVQIRRTAIAYCEGERSAEQQVERTDQLTNLMAGGRAEERRRQTAAQLVANDGR